MFTVGLFSTHIPYIAFIAFYAVFFLFGIEKASAGEFGKGAQLVPSAISITVEKHPAGDNLPDDFIRHSPEIRFKQPIFFELKTKFLTSERIYYQGTAYAYSWFSRPPPRS